MAHLLHRLYGVDAPEADTYKTEVCITIRFSTSDFIVRAHFCATFDLLKVCEVLFLVIVCSIAIAHSMGQNYKTVLCLCVSVSVCAHSHGRIS